MLGLAQTQTHEIMKASLSHTGRATVKCPFCDKCHCITVPQHLHNKPVRAECECGKSFPVLFDSRGYYRKEVRLSGEYKDTFGRKDVMTVTTLSFTGAGLEAGHSTPSITMGDTIRLSFLLNDSNNTWIKTKAIVRRVDGNRIGVVFVGLNDHQQKCLGFYLMP